MNPLRSVAPAIAIVGLLLAPLSAGAWQRAPLPAEHARVTSVALAPSQPERVFVGLRGLGVWRSAFRGVTWVDCSADLPADVVVLALQVSPIDSDLVLAGTEATAAGPGAVYRSTDAGTTWAPSSTGLGGGSVRAFAALASAPSVVYAGLSGGPQPGVYRSTDAGLTWSHISGAIPGESAYVLAIHPADPAAIVAGTEIGSAWTTDGGATWGTVDRTSGLRFLSWDPVDTSRLYGTVDDADVWASPYVTTDYGETWSTLMALPYVSAAQPIAAHPTDAGTVFVGGLQLIDTNGGGAQRAWKTTDGGATSSEIFSAARGWGPVTGLLVDPLNPAHLYLSQELLIGQRPPGGRGFHHTSDGGATWTQRIDGLLNYDIGRLCEDASGQIHALWGGHCYVAPGGAGPWQDQGVYPFTMQWEWVEGLTAGPAGNVLFRWGSWNDGDIGGHYLSKSPDGGLVWYLWDWWSNPMPPALDWDRPITDVALDPSTGQRVYVSQETTGLFRNDFGGGDFEQNYEYTLINAALEGVQLAIHPAEPLTVFAAGGPLTVEVSFDGGATTTARNAGLPAEGAGLVIEELFLELADPDHLQVVYSDGRVYETRDAGLSWQLRVALDLQGEEIEDTSWDPASGHVFLATQGAGVVTSHPLVPAGLPTSDAVSVHYSPAQQVLYVGTANAGLWYDNLPPVVGTPEIAEAGGSGMGVWPNPFRGSTTIELAVSSPDAEASVAVYDAAGRLVRQLAGGQRVGGTIQIVWDGHDADGRPLPSGVYFVRALSAGEVSSRKIVLRR